MSYGAVPNRISDRTVIGNDPDAEVTGQEGIQGEGPYMAMHLRLFGDTVSTARFDTYGCPYAIACGDWVASWAPGKTISQALALEPEDLSRILGGLPLGKEHCASLAVLSLRHALTQWREQREDGEHR